MASLEPAAFKPAPTLAPTPAAPKPAAPKPAPTPAQLAAAAEKKAKAAQRQKRVFMIRALASVVVGMVVAAVETWGGMGAVSSLVAWVVTLTCAAVLSNMTYSPTFMCMWFNQKTLKCKALALLTMAMGPVAFGATVGTVIRLALVAAGR